jgi:hypothetical protein
VTEYLLLVERDAAVAVEIGADARTLGDRSMQSPRRGTSLRAWTSADAQVPCMMAFVRARLLRNRRLNPLNLLLFLFSSQYLQQRSCPWLVCLCEYGEVVRRPALHDLVCASQEG